MTQILKVMLRAGSTDTTKLIKSLEEHEFDGSKVGMSSFGA